MTNSGIQRRIWMIFAAFLTANLLSVVFDIRSLRESLIQEKATQTRYLVDSAHQVIEHFQHLQHQGNLTEASAKRAAKEAIRSMRFGDQDYFWIHDLGQPVPRMIMHPVQPQLEGSILDAPAYQSATHLKYGDELQEINTEGPKNLFVAFNEVVTKAGHGYVYYAWPKPSAIQPADQTPYPKVAFVKQFQPWGWVLGSGVYLDEVDKKIWQGILRHALFTTLMILLLWGITWLIAQSILNTERELRDAQKAMQALIDATDESVLLLEPDGKIRAINRFGAQRFQSTPAALQGRNFLDMIPPALAESRRAAMTEALQTGESITIQDQRNGIHFQNSIHPIQNDAGVGTALAVYAKDVTRERQAKATEEVFRHLDTILLKWQMNVETVAQIFCEHIQPIYQFSATWIGRAEPGGKVSLLGQTLSESFPEEVRWDTSASPWPFVGEAIRSGHRQFGTGPSETISLALPLVLEGKTWGVLTVCSNSKAQLDKEQIFLGSLAGRLGAALEAAVQQEWLALLNTALVAVDNAVIIADGQSHILWANRAALQLCGYSLAEITGQSTTLLLAEQNTKTLSEIEQATANGSSWAGELTYRHKAGHNYAVELSITPLKDGGGKLTHQIGVLKDISQRKLEEARMLQMAYYDALTGLPNRTLLRDRLNQALHRSQRTHTLGAVLFVDLDKFKEINDQHGHAAGDEVLRSVAARLQGQVRQMDTVGRLAGDEFLVILSEVAGEAAAVHVAENILLALDAPIRYETRQLNISASIGIALFPTQGNTPDDIILAADTAMYRAKEAGKHTVRM